MCVERPENLLAPAEFMQENADMKLAANDKFEWQDAGGDACHTIGPGAPPVAFAVALVFLLVEGYQVRQGEAVVGGDEVYAVLGAPTAPPLPPSIVAPPVTWHLYHLDPPSARCCILFNTAALQGVPYWPWGAGIEQDRAPRSAEMCCKSTMEGVF